MFFSRVFFEQSKSIGYISNSYLIRSREPAGNHVEFDPKPNWCIKGRGPFGGFSQYQVLRQTPSNTFRLKLWNFTDQWRGSNPKANPPFFLLLSLSLAAASVKASIQLNLSHSPSFFQTHFFPSFYVSKSLFSHSFSCFFPLLLCAVS